MNVGVETKTNKEKYCVFHVEGGLGKHIVSTGIVKLIKENYPDRKLIVVAAWPELFLNNPYIYRVYKNGTLSYFYDDYILNKDVLIFKHEPYFETSHILKQKPLIQTWADLYNLKYEELPTPELYFNMVQNRFSGTWNRNKPVMLLHTNGGPLNDQKYNYSWTRDMPYRVGLTLVEKYSNDYHIIQVCRNQSQALPNVEVITNPMQNLELFSLVQASQKRILIDSCLQHAAAAFNLPSTVLWIGTSPVIFGHNLHKNIVANKPSNVVKLIDSYLFDYQFSGEAHECPYFDTDILFNMNEVFKNV